MVGTIAAIVILALASSLRLAFPIQASDGPLLIQLAQLPSVNGNCNAVGSGNTISNSCNQAPAPTVRIVEKVEQRRGDGTYGTNIHISVISPYPAKMLIVGIKSPDVTNVDLVPDGGGIEVNVRRGSCGDQCLGVQIGGPVIGDYWVYVNTKQKEDVSLLWRVE